MKTLEQYFQEQPLLPEDTAGKAPGTTAETTAEKAFLRKYLGVETEDQLPPAEVKAIVPEQVMAKPDAARHPQSQPPATRSGADPLLPADSVVLQKSLREQPILQLIGFCLGDQDYALPIEVVQEVIRAVEPTKLPSAPAFLSGVVNLRGKVTPLISLRTLLRLVPGDDRFIIVCRHAGLQMGLQIQSVSTMHRVRQDRIDWGVESLLGIQNDTIAGLIRAENKRLIAILSLDHLVQSLLNT